MFEGLNERQRQRFILIGESMAKVLIQALDEEGIEPQLSNPAAFEVVRAWALGWCRTFGIPTENIDARLAQELAARLQFEKPRCKPA